jgi:capsular polysaccharide biosynthesis protein
MEINDYLRIIRQRGWIILLMMVLTAAAAYGFSRMQTEIYRSTLKLLVLPSRTDFGQAQAAKDLLSSYEQWLNSSLRAQAVIQEIQLDMTPQELMGDIRVASDRNSFVITLTIDNSNPNLANDIASTWGNQLIMWQNANNDRLRQEDRITIEPLDAPQVGLERPRTSINTAAGAVFGIILGIFIIFTLEWVESGVVRRSEDVERYLAVPVIGTIPDRT